MQASLTVHSAEVRNIIFGAAAFSDNGKQGGTGTAGAEGGAGPRGLGQRQNRDTEAFI